LLPRLKTAEQFAAVLDESKRKSTGSGVWRSAHFVLHMASIEAAKHSRPGAAGPIIGVICPKRWAKRAVTRNAIKRQIYAVSSELAERLPPASFVLRLAAEFSREHFSGAASRALKKAVRSELLMLFAKPIPSQERAA
jgi:ribonuclease P protein component